MFTEGSIFRLVVRIVGLVMTVGWAPLFLAAVLSWFGSAQGWQAPTPEWRGTDATAWDWLSFVLKDACGLAIGLYLLVDGRMVIEGLYPSLKPRGATADSAAAGTEAAP